MDTASLAQKVQRVRNFQYDLSKIFKINEDMFKLIKSQNRLMNIKKEVDMFYELNDIINMLPYSNFSSDYKRMIVEKDEINNFDIGKVSLDWFDKFYSKLDETIQVNEYSFGNIHVNNNKPVDRVRAIILPLNELLQNITKLQIENYVLEKGHYVKQNVYLGSQGVETEEVYGMMLDYRNQIEKRGIQVTSKLERMPKRLNDPNIIKALEKFKMTSDDFSNFRRSFRIYNSAIKLKMMYNLYNNQNSVADKRQVVVGYKYIDELGNRYYTIDIPLLIRLIKLIKKCHPNDIINLRQQIKKIIRVIKLQSILDSHKLGYYILINDNDFSKMLSSKNKVALEGMNMAALNQFLAKYPGNYYCCRSLNKKSKQIPIVNDEKLKIIYSRKNESAYHIHLVDLHIEQPHVSVNLLIQYLNNVDNTINENNYYNMLLNEYLEVREKSRLRYCAVIENIKNYQHIVINKFNKFLDGRYKIDYVINVNHKKNYNNDRGDNLIHEIMKKVEECRNKYFTYDYVVYLYKSSILGLSTYSLTQISSILNTQLPYTRYIKPLLRTKLILGYKTLFNDLLQNISTSSIESKNAVEQLAENQKLPTNSATKCNVNFDFSIFVSISKTQDGLPLIDFLLPLNNVEYSILIPMVFLWIFGVEYDRNKYCFEVPVVKINITAQPFFNGSYYEYALKEYQLLSDNKILIFLQNYKFNLSKNRLEPNL
jgi:hypothetical protein